MSSRQMSARQMTGYARRLSRSAVRRFTGPVGTLRAVVTARPVVVLTYDDGPDDTGTEAVLSALAAQAATATFFVLMGRARRNPNLVREVVAAGHEVALHGLDHVRLTTLAPGEVLRRTRAGRAELEDLIDAPVRWFRPPYGAQLPRTWLAIKRAGLVPVVWGPTPRDWEHRDEVDLAQQAMVGIDAGEIVLAHDGHAGRDDGVDDGPPPPIDRGRLAQLMLDGFGERGLVARSLRDALIDGEEKRWLWLLK